MYTEYFESIRTTRVILLDVKRVRKAQILVTFRGFFLNETVMEML